MKVAKALFFMLAVSMLMGCPVVSKNIVGLQEFKIDAQKLDGTWINDEGAILIKTIDAEKGIIKITFLEDREKIESVKIKIMKGKSWLYFNVLPEQESKDDDFMWGRFQPAENRIIFWHAASQPFARAIKQRIIQGFIKKEKQKDEKISFTTSTVVLTDSAENIINLVEKSEKSFFLWDEPVFFIKLIK